MIDSHCHLFESENTSNEIETANLAGVKKFICAGAGLLETRTAIKISEQDDKVYVAAGFGYSPENKDPNDWELKLIKIADHTKVIAIGECGLDFYTGITETQKRKQIRWFEMHVRVAKKTGLPLVVHCRNAFEETYQIIKTNEVLAQLHCYTGDEEWMKKFIDVGCYISYGGIITFKRSEELRSVVTKTPQERLLVETDAPYLAPEPFRGNRNEVKNVMIVANKVAELRQQTIDEVDKYTTENTYRLFNKMV